MVSGILAYKFGAPFAWITSLSVAAYVFFTLTVTQVTYLLPLLFIYDYSYELMHFIFLVFLLSPVSVRFVSHSEIS